MGKHGFQMGGGGHHCPPLATALGVMLKKEVWERRATSTLDILVSLWTFDKQCESACR